MAVCAIIPVQCLPADRLKIKVDEEGLQEENPEPVSKSNAILKDLNKDRLDLDENIGHTEDPELAKTRSTKTPLEVIASTSSSPVELLKIPSITSPSKSTYDLDGGKDVETSEYPVLSVTGSNEVTTIDAEYETQTSPETTEYIPQTAFTTDTIKAPTRKTDFPFQTSSNPSKFLTQTEYIFQTTEKSDFVTKIGNNFPFFTPSNLDISSTSIETFPKTNQGRTLKKATSIMPLDLSTEESNSLEVPEDYRESINEDDTNQSDPCNSEYYQSDFSFKSYCQFWSSGSNYYELIFDYMNCVKFQYSIYDYDDC